VGDAGYTTAIDDSLDNSWGGGDWMFQLPTETDSPQFFYHHTAGFGFQEPNDHEFFNCGFDAIFTHLT